MRNNTRNLEKNTTISAKIIIKKNTSYRLGQSRFPVDRANIFDFFLKLRLISPFALWVRP